MALGSATGLVDRVGVLVATNAAGYLPDDIIRKAPDADKVDGLHATAFARAAAVRSCTGAVTQAGSGSKVRALVSREDIAPAGACRR